MQPDPARRPLVHLPPTLFLDDYALFWENLLAPDDAFAVWQETIDVLRDEGGAGLLHLPSAPDGAARARAACSPACSNT